MRTLNETSNFYKYTRNHGSCRITCNFTWTEDPKKIVTRDNVFRVVVQWDEHSEFDKMGFVKVETIDGSAPAAELVVKLLTRNGLFKRALYNICVFGGRERGTFKVLHNYGQSGCSNHYVRYRKAPYYWKNAKGVHVSMYGKLNEGIEISLADAIEIVRSSYLFGESYDFGKQKHGQKFRVRGKSVWCHAIPLENDDDLDGRVFSRPNFTGNYSEDDTLIDEELAYL